MAKTKEEVERQSKNDRLWESLDYSYGKKREASNKAYDNARSQMDRQALSRGMQRSFYNNQSLANLNKQKIDADQDIWNAQIADYQNRLTDLENQEEAMDLQERQFAEQQRQFDANLAYNQERAKVADTQFNLQFGEGQRQFDTNLAWQREQAAAQQKQAAEQMAYNRERAAVADNQWNLNFAYQKERDQVGDTQWERQFAEGVRQFDAQHGNKSGGSSGSPSGKDKETETPAAAEPPKNTTAGDTFGQFFTRLGAGVNKTVSNPNAREVERTVEFVKTGIPNNTKLVHLNRLPVKDETLKKKPSFKAEK